MINPDNKKHSPFIRVPHKIGDKPYHLYAAMAEEGPIYYSIGVDEEGDAFEIEFDDGCATLFPDSYKYLVLSGSSLAAIQSLNEWAEEHYQEWADTKVGKIVEAMAEQKEVSPDDAALFNAEYKHLIGTTLEIRFDEP